MRTVFSRNAPVLAFNDLSDQTDSDEQEGMMHLFEGAALAIRNPGRHSFPEGPEQRAVEYLSLLSLLAYRVQETRVVANEYTVCTNAIAPSGKMCGRGDQAGLRSRSGRSRSRQVPRRQNTWQRHAGAPEGGSPSA